MEYAEMSKEELITVIEKLNKKLYHKKAARLSWKKIMGGKLVTGPDYWSNGHFALKNVIPMPEAINKLKDLYPRDTETSLDELIGQSRGGEPKEQTLTNKDLWKENDNKEIVMENEIKFQKLYIDVLEKLIPDFTMQFTGAMNPALIYSKGELMGLLMPLRY